MFVLRLHDMRSDNQESLFDIGLSDNQENIIKFVTQELVSPYVEDNFNKVFKKGGPLEWYDLPKDEAQSYLEIATEEAYIEFKRTEYKNYLNSLPKIYIKESEEQPKVKRTRKSKNLPDNTKVQ